MIEKARRTRRRAGWTALAAVLLAAGLVAVAHAATSDFFHWRLNLSNTQGRTSVYPDLAMSSDRDWVAVAWVEGYGSGAGDRGHVYLRAASESGGRWGDLIPVYSGDEFACAYSRAAVAITYTAGLTPTAHIAYVVNHNSCGSPSYTKLYYTTCALDSGTCQDPYLVMSTATSQYLISWVDLALDADGEPHLVYARYEPNELEQLEGKIRYRARSGGTWQNDGVVFDEGSNNRPAIAWSDGYAHVVWQNEANDGEVRYGRRDTQAAGDWNTQRLWPTGGGGWPVQYPAVAAGSGQVFVVWDALRRAGSYPEPDDYALFYRRSSNSGSSFDLNWREVGTDKGPTGDFSEYTGYTAADAPGGYLEYLQPSVAVNDDGWPAVVWHAGQITGTYFTYGTTGTTSSSVAWISPTLLIAGQSGAPVVGVGEPLTEAVQLLHIAYMENRSGTWDVYYDSSHEYHFDYQVYLPLVARAQQVGD